MIAFTLTPSGAGLNFCYAYLDDLLVASGTPEEHIKHLHIVFQCLVKHGVVVNMAKYKLDVPELSFMGHNFQLRSSASRQQG